jgi:uncharacterized SAM-binding protein YcdF (DUF218 family)
MDKLKLLVELLFSPLGILVVLLFMGVVLSFSKRYSNLGRRVLLSGALIYLIFMFSPLADFLIRNLEKQFPPMLSPPASPKVDRVVILSGYGAGNPDFPITSNLSEQTVGRLVEGIRLYHQVPGVKLIVSGGIIKKGDEPLAKLMSDFLRQIGVPAEDIVMEGKSRNTYENLTEVRKLVGANPFLLVTSGCDLPRAMGVARKLQMNPLPAPACIWSLQHYPTKMSVTQTATAFITGFAYPSTTRLSRIQWAYHEYLGYIWYWLLNRV